MRGLAKRAALLLLAGGLVLTGAASGFADKPGARPDREPARITLVGINKKGHERRGQHFSPARLNTLVVVVDWRTLVGAHVQRLELITPAGSLYQRFTSNVQSAHGRTSVETPVPVAGTWITEYQLFGEWTVNVYLDGGTTPVASTNFTLAH